MSFAQHLRRPLQLEADGRKDRLRICSSVRLQLSQLSQKFASNFAEIQISLDGNGRDALLWIELGYGIPQEPAAEFRQPGGRKRESGGGAVASEAHEEFRHRFECFQKVKGRN